MYKEWGREKLWSVHTRRKSILYCETVNWLTPVVDQAQVAGLQDAVAALENNVKAAEAEKSKLKKENKELCKADADKEKEITELVKDLPVPCAL